MLYLLQNERPVKRGGSKGTKEEVLMPDGSGLAIISNGGLVAFSNTAQVQVAPNPPGSKLMGAFGPAPPVEEPL